MTAYGFAQFVGRLVAELVRAEDAYQGHEAMEDEQGGAVALGQLARTARVGRAAAVTLAPAPRNRPHSAAFSVVSADPPQTPCSW